MRRGGNGSFWTEVNRLRRSCGFDGNDLRRDIDRRQRSIALGLVVFYLGAAPVAATQIAQVAHDRGVRAEREEAATRHQVTATVVDPGSQRAEVRIPTTVTWTEPDGGQHTGATIGWRGRPDKGESQRIWVDDENKPTIRPRTRSQTLVDTWAAAVATSLGAAVPFMAAHALFRSRFDRRRYREWDAAWERLDTHSST